MHRSLPSLLAAIGFILAAIAPAPAAGRSGPLRADLDGRPIPVDMIASYHCHDLDYPVIHCFSTESALEATVLDLGTSEALGPEPLGSSYIELFDGTAYSGSSIYLSADYTNLGVLGWNDRASSYIAQNSLTSALYVNTSYSGDALYPCCNQGAPSLSSTFDNKISSSRRT